VTPGWVLPLQLSGAMRAPWTLALLLTVGCTDPVGDDDLLDDGKSDGAGGFSEVDPEHSNVTFRRYIEAAVRLLERNDSELAQLTAESIRERRVLIDELIDLTCWDFDRARKDLPDAGLVPDDWFTLQAPGSDAAKKLTENLDGYMWSNRIYVARGLTVKRLASTIIHEVNHVINRSEVGYYDNLPTSGFVHEYRSFAMEAQFDPAEYEGIDLVDFVIENYELDRDKIDPGVLKEPLSPTLIPDEAAWDARDVAADVPDDDSLCPSNLPPGPPEL
jgi:hypothetical protein